MNREIKFRAWDKKMGTMYIELSVYRNGFRIPNNSTTGHDDDTGHFIKWDEENPRAILMQYTGLHDKQGKEIYEGDITRYFIGEKECFSEVIFNNGRFESFVGLDDKSMETFKIEVIGNIYENPNLLN